MKFYVSHFYVGSGDIDFKEAKEFKNLRKALKFAKELLEVLGEGWEVCLGKGEGDEDWYPPIK